MNLVQPSPNISYFNNPINGGKLPIELVNDVLSKLDLVSLSALSQTSQFFRQIAETGGHWKGAFSEKFIKAEEDLKWGSIFNKYLSASYCTFPHNIAKDWESSFINNYYNYCRENQRNPFWYWESTMAQALDEYSDPMMFAPHVQDLIALRWAKSPHPILVCEGIRQGLFGTLKQETLIKIAQKLCNQVPDRYGHRVISDYIEIFGIEDSSIREKIKAEAVKPHIFPNSSSNYWEPFLIPQEKRI